MTVLDDYLNHHLPSKESAKVHIKLTIKEYGQMEDGVLERQLRLAARGLYVAGFNWKEIDKIVEEAKEEGL